MGEIEKPKGNFKCVVCGKVWDGSELYIDSRSLGVRWCCGDLTCGGSVIRMLKKKTMRLVCQVYCIRFADRTVSLGDIFEVPEGEGRGLINLGYAEKVNKNG